MKFFRNKITLALLGFLLLQVPAQADDDQPITVKELPVNAQQLLKKDFANFKVVYAEMDKDLRSKSYEVKFANGGSIDFDKKGEWTEIDCGTSAVPAKFIPQAIRKQVEKKWPNTTIVKIEKDRKRYEIELSDGLEITFNQKFKITDIDR